VYVHFEQKRNTWNDQHPDLPMTLTNSAIDHIRPVDAFQKGCLLEKTTLCNRLSNLQPLLIQDNTWKGCAWNLLDEAHWREHIIGNACKDIYYPRGRLPLSLIEQSAVKQLVPTFLKVYLELGSR